MARRDLTLIPDILAPREVAQIFGVGAATVSHWANEGTLASFRTPGGHRRFRKAAVVRLMHGDPEARPTP